MHDLFQFDRYMTDMKPLSLRAWEYVRSIRPTKKFWREAVYLTCATLLIVYWNGIRPPSDFPEGLLIRVPEGSSVQEIARRLEGQRVIQSEWVFTAYIAATGQDGKLKAGEYVFSTRRNVFGITDAIVHGEFGLAPIKVTIPEGATSFEIASILNQKLGTDQDEFLKIARRSEGYLFPDTYFFLPNASPEHIVRVLQDTFFEKITEYEGELLEKGKTLSDVVTMASLLEKEAYTKEQMEQIAAILWRRIEIDMPLQVDAVFGYIYERPTFHPKYSHLAVDSPYNTYKYKGLPPGPIANPGLASIEAALDPAKNDYLYYLSDSQGNIHYSKRYEDHLRKKDQYIN